MTQGTVELKHFHELKSLLNKEKDTPVLVIFTKLINAKEDCKTMADFDEIDVDDEDEYA